MIHTFSSDPVTVQENSPVATNHPPRSSFTDRSIEQHRDKKTDASNRYDSTEFDRRQSAHRPFHRPLPSFVPSHGPSSCFPLSLSLSRPRFPGSVFPGEQPWRFASRSRRTAKFDRVSAFPAASLGLFVSRDRVNGRPRGCAESGRLSREFRPRRESTLSYTRIFVRIKYLLPPPNIVKYIFIRSSKILSRQRIRRSSSSSRSENSEPNAALLFQHSIDKSTDYPSSFFFFFLNTESSGRDEGHDDCAEFRAIHSSIRRIGG